MQFGRCELTCSDSEKDHRERRRSVAREPPLADSQGGKEAASASNQTLPKEVSNEAQRKELQQDYFDNERYYTCQLTSNDGGYRQAVENVRKAFPKLDVTTSLAFIVESID